MAQPGTSPAPAADLAKEVGRRRTFAIISHPDAGKTTLTEKLLLFGGAIQLAGTVKARRSSRHATSDWMEVEKQRGISVTSSVMQFEYAGHTINLLDTPGHEDFSEDTYRVLTAVDAAVMVIDAAKGVEAQTLKLLDVCRLRNTPIITFVNKMDREVRSPLSLLEEIEGALKIECAPISWPIGMGKSFRGVYHLLQDRLLRFTPGEEKRTSVEEIHGLDNPQLDALFPDEVGSLRADVGLIRDASTPFDQGQFLAGRQSPVFFGSGINNFGVQEVLQALVDWAPPPQPRDGGARLVEPTEAAFSGFVFKIQANMDPKHRDRIAFFRICSGRYVPGMKARHLRSGRDMKLANALTFMAKYNEREGNSCHIHLSFRGTDGAMVMADPTETKHGMSDVGRQFIAGQLAHLRELSLLFAPNINSYKRFAPGSFAPTSIEWGRDNRTCALRLVGRGAGLRVENRIPGGDVNPYLAVAGMVAASLAGIENGLELREEFAGNAYQAGGERAPWRLVDAVELWERSEWVAETFGEDVQAHYANMGRIEVDAFDRSVTDWERIRSFERM